MELIAKLVPNFSEIFKITFLFISKGGWVLFVIGMIYILYRLYISEIREQYLHNQKWIFLSIKVPRENLASTLGVEAIFAQMHSLHVSPTFAEKYVEGQVQLWYSLEIVSLGGNISFVIRLPAKMRHVVEAAIYSQYPDAEIAEIADYFENFHYDPESTTDIEIFGTEWTLTDDEVIPIKTYRDFEHPAAEEKIIDPLAGFFEGLSKMEPHEFFGVQIIIQPLGDDEWKPKGEAKVKELTGEEVPHEFKFTDLLLAPLNWFAEFSFKKALAPASHHNHAETQQQKSNWLNMTEIQKERVTLIEKKIGKPGYKTKIRFLYVAPKDKFDPNKKSIMIGAYRPLGSAMTNKFKPDVSRTWTTVQYKFSPELEKPYLDWLLKKKKRHIFRGFKNRDIHIGSPMFVLNIEELATLYHFPITTKPVTAAIEKTQSKKAQPPVDLPVVAIY